MIGKQAALVLDLHAYQFMVNYFSKRLQDLIVDTSHASTLPA